MFIVRCAQYRNRLTKKLSSCPFTALEYLQASHSCTDTIHLVARNPFACLYSSPSQQRLYSAYRKHRRYIKVAADATVVHKLDRPGNRKSGPIFLYALVIADGYQAAINSMLSEMHDTNFISYWLSEWIRNGATIPDEYVSDMSLALLGAAVKAFTKQSTLSMYIEYLYQMHTIGCPSDPGCFIRIDIAHFMKNVAKCKPLINARKKVRDFYITCVALLVKIKSLEDAKYYIHAILVVALSKTEGISEDKDDIPCETLKKILIRRIQGLDIHSFSNESDDARQADTNGEINANEEDSDDFDYEIHRQKEHNTYIESFANDNSSFSDWIINIKEQAAIEATTHDVGDRDNLMFNPLFAKYFTDLIKTLPIWSSLNCEFFQYSDETASTANCESYFKDNKASHKDIIPCRIDTFVAEDIKMIDGLVIEASQQYIECVGDRNVMEQDFIGPVEELSIQDSSIAHQDSFTAGSTSRSYVESEYEKDSVIANSSALQKRLYSLYHPQSNLEDDHIANHSPKANKSSENQLIDCIACSNNHFPDGAHRCYKCGKNVHIMSGCSNSIEDDEGYGEKRICISCSNNSAKVLSRKRSFPIDNFSSELANELNNKEKWNKKKKKVKKSSYLHPAPNWDLIINVDKKVKIGLLSNGSLSKTSYNVNGKAVALRNTCAFDTIVQILAAGYAYFEPYRHAADSSVDKIFEIVISLARNENLKKVNGMRATLLYTLFQSNNCKMVISDIMSKALKNTPTLTEIQSCSREQCKYSCTKIFPSMGVCTDTLKNDFRNLKLSILKNFPEVEPKCSLCKTSVCTSRIYGDHLFIEMPVTSYDHEHSNNFEFENEVKLEDFPISLELDAKIYALFGVAIYQPPLISGDSGHYMGAVKLNNTWQVFDDLKAKPYNIKKSENVIVHHLFYISKI